MTSYAPLIRGFGCRRHQYDWRGARPEFFIGVTTSGPKAGSGDGVLPEGAATPSLHQLRVWECWGSGWSPDRPKDSTIASSQDGLSWHYNIVLPRSHWDGRPPLSLLRTPLTVGHFLRSTDQRGPVTVLDGNTVSEVDLSG